MTEDRETQKRLEFDPEKDLAARDDDEFVPAPKSTGKVLVEWPPHLIFPRAERFLLSPLTVLNCLAFEFEKTGQDERAARCREVIKGAFKHFIPKWDEI